LLFCGIKFSTLPSIILYELLSIISVSSSYLFFVPKYTPKTQKVENTIINNPENNKVPALASDLSFIRVVSKSYNKHHKSNKEKY
jgi:hypothetical protein